MSDLISRQAAIEDLQGKDPSQIWDTADIEVWVNALPTADVAPVVHGKWIDMGDFEQCSVCTCTRLKEVQTVYGKAIWIKTQYCPACGAKMDGGEDARRTE